MLIGVDVVEDVLERRDLQREGLGPDLSRQFIAGNPDLFEEVVANPLAAQKSLKANNWVASFPILDLIF